MSFLFSDEDLATIAEKGRISKYFSGNERPAFTPNEAIATAIAIDIDSIDANLGVEALFRDEIGDEDPDMLRFANLLLSFSKLEGLEYFSASRGKLRLLFEESYIASTSRDSHVKDNALPARISDPRISGLPATSTSILYQKDLTFGSSLYEATLEASSEMIHVRLENLTPFRYGPIRLIKSHEMRLHIYLVHGDEYLYYYSVFCARSFRLPIMDQKIFTSFYNRIAALYGWFAQAVSESQ
jgi:hypothetical protein